MTLKRGNKGSESGEWKSGGCAQKHDVSLRDSPVGSDFQSLKNPEEEALSLHARVANVLKDMSLTHQERFEKIRKLRAIAGVEAERGGQEKSGTCRCLWPLIHPCLPSCPPPHDAQIGAGNCEGGGRDGMTV